jgi:hypothetical protein
MIHGVEEGSNRVAVWIENVRQNRSADNDLRITNELTRESMVGRDDLKEGKRLPRARARDRPSYFFKIDDENRVW